jgi:hypothetical protein
MGSRLRSLSWSPIPLRMNRIMERLQLCTHCALLAPPERLHFREGNRMKKSIACILAAITATTMGITACASSGSTTATTTTTTAASAAAPVPTPYTDYNGFTCTPAQANNGGFCPDDPAAKPNGQSADSQPSSAASSTVAASSTPAPAPPPSTSAPAAVPSTTEPAAAPSTTAPAAAPSTSSGCYPLSDEGTCYEPGEYCRDSDHGASGVAGDGESIICEDNDGWRWEPA